jgi:hypothetical protein
MIAKDIRMSMEKSCCSEILEPLPGQELTDNGEYFSKPVRVGKATYGGHILLCGKRDSTFPYHCMVGPDWPLMVFVYFLIIVIDTVVLTVISALGVPVFVIGLVGFISLLLVYSKLACSDPGIVYKTDETHNEVIGMTSQNNFNVSSSNERLQTYLNTASHHSSHSQAKSELIPCGTCEISRPVTAKHCLYCGVCIDELDHHCPCKYS